MQKKGNKHSHECSQHSQARQRLAKCSQATCGMEESVHKVLIHLRNSVSVPIRDVWLG